MKRLAKELLDSYRSYATEAAAESIRRTFTHLFQHIDALEAELTTERHDFNQLMLASDVIEKERDELKVEVKEQCRLNGMGQERELKLITEKNALQKRVSELEAALGDILSNVALDWYVQQFAKNETPTLSASGIAAKIHNRELYERCAAAFERARRALAQLREKDGK